MTAITPSSSTPRPRATGWPSWLRQLGWPGLLGTVLLLACAWYIQVVLPQRHQAVDQTESEARRLRHGLIARSRPGDLTAEAPRLDEAQAWARLWAGLPDDTQRLQRQARVLDLAAQVGVPLTSVQWQAEPVRWIAPAAKDDAAPSAPGLWRQRMAMPVQAPYPALRTWLDRLQREPGLSIDTLDIQRNDVQSDVVQAQVSISLWWRQPRRASP